MFVSIVNLRTRQKCEVGGDSGGIHYTRPKAASRTCMGRIYQASDAYWSIFLSAQRALGILGESGRETALRYLSRGGIPEEEIPVRFGEFVKKLQEMFGPGALIIEREILGNLKLMEPCFQTNRTLSDAVRELGDGAR